MSATPPLLSRHRSRAALISSYADDADAVPIVQTFGQLDIEYAALRKHCVLFDAPHRGTLEITGADRLTFLDAMVTQRTRDLQPGQWCDSFWLTRKGRIAADLRLIELPGRLLVDLDRLVAKATPDSLAEFLFSEDVTITDRTSDLCRLWLLGPTSVLLLAEICDRSPEELEPGTAAEFTIGGAPVIIVRDNLADVPAFHLTVECDRAGEVYDRLIEVGEAPETDPGESLPDTPASRIRLKPSGWHAINVARIESGAPMFNIDFGATNLPAETSLLDSRVDFKKGCYLGQEVVARMDALGHPKQAIVALRVEGTDDLDHPPQADTGAELHAPDDPDKPLGAVTSSTISPMLSAASICLAMVKWGSHEPGTELTLLAEGRQAKATVQPALASWPRPASDGSSDRR